MSIATQCFERNANNIRYYKGLVTQQLANSCSCLCQYLFNYFIFFGDVEFVRSHHQEDALRLDDRGYFIGYASKDIF